MWSAAHLFVRIFTRMNDGKFCALTTIDRHGEGVRVAAISDNGRVFDCLQTEPMMEIQRAKVCRGLNMQNITWLTFFEMIQQAFVDRAITIEFVSEKAAAAAGGQVGVVSGGSPNNGNGGAGAGANGGRGGGANGKNNGGGHDAKSGMTNDTQQSWFRSTANSSSAPATYSKDDARSTTTPGGRYQYNFLAEDAESAGNGRGSLVSLEEPDLILTITVKSLNQLQSDNRTTQIILPMRQTRDSAMMRIANDVTSFIGLRTGDRREMERVDDLLRNDRVVRNDNITTRECHDILKGSVTALQYEIEAIQSELNRAQAELESRAATLNATQGGGKGDALLKALQMYEEKCSTDILLYHDEDPLAGFALAPRGTALQIMCDFSPDEEAVRRVKWVLEQKKKINFMDESQTNAAAAVNIPGGGGGGSGGHRESNSSGSSTYNFSRAPKAVPRDLGADNTEIIPPGVDPAVILELRKIVMMNTMPGQQQQQAAAAAAAAAAGGGGTNFFGFDLLLGLGSTAGSGGSNPFVSPTSTSDGGGSLVGPGKNNTHATGLAGGNLGHLKNNSGGNANVVVADNASSDNANDGMEDDTSKTGTDNKTNNSSGSPGLGKNGQNNNNNNNNMNSSSIGSPNGPPSVNIIKSIKRDTDLCDSIFESFMSRGNDTCSLEHLELINYLTEWLGDWKFNVYHVEALCAKAAGAMSSAQKFTVDPRRVTKDLQLAPPGALFYVGYLVFVKLNLMKQFAMSERKVVAWLRAVEMGYRQTGAPFHSSVRAADVLQAIYCLIAADTKRNVFNDRFALILIIASILSHYRHPGNVDGLPQTLLDAHGPTGALQRHHVAAGYALFELPEYDILDQVSDGSKRLVHEYVGNIIVSSDLAVHDATMSTLRLKLASMDLGMFIQTESCLFLSIILKLATVVFTARECDPFAVAVKDLLAEAKGDRTVDPRDEQRRMSMLTMSAIDQVKISASEESVSSLLNLINTIALPLFATMGEIFPSVRATGQHILSNKTFASSLRENMSSSQKVSATDSKNKVMASQ